MKCLDLEISASIILLQKRTELILSDFGYRRLTKAPVWATGHRWGDTFGSRVPFDSHGLRRFVRLFIISSRGRRENDGASRIIKHIPPVRGGTADAGEDERTL